MGRPKEERVKSGIEGLDELLNGGFIPNSSILVMGTTGAGKTIFASQFIYWGAKEYNETGVYLSFEEPVESIKETAAVLGMDFDELKGKVVFLNFDPRRHIELKEMLHTTVLKSKAKRVVIDTISAWGPYVGSVSAIRRNLFELNYMLKKLGVTTLLTSEVPLGEKIASRFQVEEFIADCIIVLNYLRKEKYFERSLIVWKMRRSDHSKGVHPFEITKNGIVVYPKEFII